MTARLALAALLPLLALPGLTGVASGAEPAEPTAPATEPPADPRPASGAIDPIELDARALAELRSFLDGLDRDLSGALGGDAEARKALVRRALQPGQLTKELDAFLAKARALEATRAVHMTGFEVTATMWYGLVPIREVELFFWVTPSAIRLLRLSPRPSARSTFDGRGEPEWAGPPGTSLGTVAGQVLEAGVAERCDAIPFARRADYADILPADEAARRKTIQHLETFRFQLAATCRKLGGWPFHRIGWEPADLAGVIDGADGRKVSFRLQMVRTPDGDIAIANLRPPVAPPRPQDPKP